MIIKINLTITMQLNAETLINQAGTEALQHFYEVYVAQ